MTIRMIEGFDHLSPSPGLAFGDFVTYGKWTDFANPALQSATQVTGRYGAPGSALRIQTGGGFNGYLRKRNAFGGLQLGAAPGYIVIGFAFQWESGSQGTLLDVVDQAGADQFSLQVDGNSRWQLTRGLGVTQLAQSAASVQAGRWYHLELKYGISPTVGFASLRVDGVEVFNISGVNTRQTTLNTVSDILVGVINAGSRTVLLDDLYVLDEAGTVNNDFLGERRVYTLYPTAAGALTQFVLGGSTPAPTNWQSVDDPTPTGDVDYITSSALSTDTYAFGDLPAQVNVVNAVQLNLAARKTDAGARSIAPIQRSAGGTVVAGSNLPVGANYAVLSSIAETSLVTTTAWTPSEVNVSEFGVRITA